LGERVLTFNQGEKKSIQKGGKAEEKKLVRKLPKTSGGFEKSAYLEGVRSNFQGGQRMGVLWKGDCSRGRRFLSSRGRSNRERNYCSRVIFEIGRLKWRVYKEPRRMGHFGKKNLDENLVDGIGSIGHTI